MVQYHKRTKTKRTGTGGEKRNLRDKRLANYGGFFIRPKFEKEAKEEVRETSRGKGANKKVRLRVALHANVVDKQGTAKKVRITDVVESRDNRHYARENIITRGTLIETEAGKARVTSKPSQHGIVNAVLV